jgi:phospholipid N-methyltransferase
LPAFLDPAALGKARAVVSGLPLLSMPPARRAAILAGAFAALAPSGVFVQFTYGFASPVPRRELVALGLQPLRRDFTWRNLPPATVWLFVRADSARASGAQG